MCAPFNMSYAQFVKYAFALPAGMSNKFAFAIVLVRLYVCVCEACVSKQLVAFSAEIKANRARVQRGAWPNKQQLINILYAFITARSIL